MRGAERIIFAFAALGETGKPATLTQGADTFAAAGENFMRVSLMTDIPDKNIFGRIEDVMQRGCQFDNAKAGAKMAACDRNGVNGFGTELGGELRQLLPGLACVQIFGIMDMVSSNGVSWLTRNLHFNLRSFDLAFLQMMLTRSWFDSLGFNLVFLLMWSKTGSRFEMHCSGFLNARPLAAVQALIPIMLMKAAKLRIITAISDA